MKRSTFMGCFVGLLALTMQAQIVQPSISTTQQGTTKIEDQKKAGTSIEDLLVRYNNVGNQSGSISDHFTMQEQLMLRSYFSNNSPISTEVANNVQYTPLFVTPEVLTAEDEAEILADAQYRANSNMENSSGVTNNRNPLADITPTAGATETFNPAVGDNFFDPGGPGGSTTGGTPGNYPNCGCDTQTTLAGVSEIDFLYFSVFANFDYLRIYDGTDATGTLLYDNGAGGPNEGDRELADMIASHGSSTFTAASGNFFFFFHSSTVVDYGGWDVEIVSTGGGGGGGALTTVYGINNSNQDLIGFGVATPGTTEIFGTSPVTVNFENAGAIDPANPTTGYALDNAGQFYSFDVTSGFYTLLGNIPGDWIGMEFDRVSGTLYGIAGADLYTIDPVAVTATLVGATGINPSDLPIALAIDGAGVGYTYEIVTDNLYSIDLATATATLIGNIGFDANFGQGMCYDPTTDMVYMSAFNGTAFASEWRSVNTTTGATTLIGEIITPATTTQVAWSSIGETLPPPSCPEPTNLVVSNITETTADLSWSAEPNASNGYVWYVFLEGANPAVDPAVSTGTTVAGTTTATAGGLTNGIAYDFYVVADCDVDGLSSYAGPVTFETLITPPVCGGKFYDTGGAAGDYENNANVTTTITPTNAGELVTVTFTSFEVETGWDALYVYDGPDASAPIISSGNPATNSGFPAGGYYGTTNPGPFTSSHATGALTFVFLSDASVPQAGWEADVTCALSAPPNDLIVNSIDVDEIGFPYTDPAVHMPAATTEGGNPLNCDLTGANGVWYNFVSGGDGQANAMIVTPSGASSVTFYTAPDENATETDLVLVPQNTNQCVPGTSASIYTLAGQAYYVFVLNTGAITDIVIDGTNLSVSENTIAGFSFYPNPTNGILNLNSVDNIEHVSLYNLLGQIVVNNRVDATTSQIDISGLSTGTYLMKVTVNGQTGTYKVLKD